LTIVYYTSGISGSGRVVRGISIGNALRRAGKNAEFVILSSSPFAHLADKCGFAHREISTETEDQLSPNTYRHSELFHALIELEPDVLLIDLLWFPLYSFIHELPSKTVFLWQQLRPEFFSIDLPDDTIEFQSDQFDLVVAIEPCSGPGPAMKVNPMILRNHGEILPRAEALEALGLDDSSKNCLLAVNAHPGDFDRTRERYSYLASSGYRMVNTTNYRGGIFPVVDYFNAFDLVVCGASYNSFWEVIYFDKEAIFVPVRTQFVDSDRLIRDYRNYRFEENGADQLVKMIYDL
jgi:hypothetical protein